MPFRGWRLRWRAPSFHTLAFVLLLAGCDRRGHPEAAATTETAARPVAPPPITPSPLPGCPAEASGSRVSVTLLRQEDDRQVMKVEPDPELGGEASLMARVDLNGDGHQDLILRFFELCGNYGECPFAAYAGCGGDEYVTVRPSEYATALEIRPRGGMPWAELSETVRKDDDAAGDPLQRTLRFDQGSYRPVP